MTSIALSANRLANVSINKNGCGKRVFSEWSQWLAVSMICYRASTSRLNVLLQLFSSQRGRPRPLRLSFLNRILSVLLGRQLSLKTLLSEQCKGAKAVAVRQ